MPLAFIPPVGLTVAAAALAALFAAILPTCLYLYVEPRGRMSWGVAGDSPQTRRAPWVVRLAAWLSFAVGQLALPWLLVPAACAGLFYLQAKLGFVRPLGAAATIAVALLALAQSLVAVRLLPIGVRLLARDSRLRARGVAIARQQAIAAAIFVAIVTALGWGMAAVPALVHPWLRTALVWTALRPIAVYAVALLVHAVLLGQAARALAEPERAER